MFSFREFVKRGFLNAVGKLPDYRIILNAAGYSDKGVLTESDLEEIAIAMETRDTIARAPIEAQNENQEAADGTDI